MRSTFRRKPKFYYTIVMGKSTRVAKICTYFDRQEAKRADCTTIRTRYIQHLGNYNRICEEIEIVNFGKTSNPLAKDYTRTRVKSQAITTHTRVAKKSSFRPIAILAYVD